MPSRLFELLAMPRTGFAVACNGVRAPADVLARDAARIAGLLQQNGLRHGDRVGLWLPNGADWLRVALACSRLGVAILALNPRLGSKEIGDLLGVAGCKALVLSAEHRDGYCVDILKRLSASSRASLHALAYAGAVEAFDGCVGMRLFGLNDELSGEEPLCEGNPGDAFLMLSTSGTTSLPKLVQHSQERICRHVLDVTRTMELSAPGSKMLLGIPMCGAYGFTITMASLAAGIPLIVMEAFDPAGALRLIREHGVTHMMGTDDMLDKMLSATDEPNPMPSLRMFGHANFTPSLRDFPQRAEARGVRLRGAYGLSETLSTVAAQSVMAPLERRAEGGGHLVCEDAGYRIRDLESGELIADGRIGEIEIRTPNVMLGYFNNPEATQRAFTPDGFLRTGDLGHHAGDGGFTYLARINDVLRIGGYLVSPGEIEEVVKGDPAIDTCQVVAVDLPEGPRPVAFVVVKPECRFSEDQGLALCRAALARYKVPIRIFALQSMPVTVGPNGVKVKKAELREMARQMFETQ